jgi:hypothetical protein
VSANAQRIWEHQRHSTINVSVVALFPLSPPSGAIHRSPSINLLGLRLWALAIGKNRASLETSKSAADLCRRAWPVQFARGDLACGSCQQIASRTRHASGKRAQCERQVIQGQLRPMPIDAVDRMMPSIIGNILDGKASRHRGARLMGRAACVPVRCLAGRYLSHEPRAFPGTNERAPIRWGQDGTLEPLVLAAVKTPVGPPVERA